VGVLYTLPYFKNFGSPFVLEPFACINKFLPGKPKVGFSTIAKPSDEELFAVTPSAFINDFVDVVFGFAVFSHNGARSF
jgi:hypothetical protein